MCIRDRVCPIAPGEKYTGPFPAVELSFELIENSMKDLQRWYQQSNSDTSSKRIKKLLIKTAENYMQRVGVSSQLVPSLLNDLENGVALKESSSYPKILKMYKSLNIELRKFESMIMHICNLGVEKSLISKSPIIVNRKKKVQNKYWQNLTSSIKKSKKASTPSLSTGVNPCHLLERINTASEHPVGNQIITWLLQGFPCFILPHWIALTLPKP